MGTTATPATGSATAGPAGPAGGYRRAITVRAAQILAEDALFGAVLLVAAGTVRWWNAWAFVGLFLACVIAAGSYALPRNPEIAAARGRRHRGTRTFDTVLMTGYSVCYLALFVVAGLDAGRFRWAPLGWPVAVAGAVLLVASMVPVAGALAVNRNLETTVRIQHERGHRVASAGPYRLVRHPMYVGMLLQLPGTALLLGSAWALVPASACAVLLVVRTALEDRTLHRDLPGYAEFAAKTRHRLVPGVW